MTTKEVDLLTKSIRTTLDGVNWDEFFAKWPLPRLWHLDGLEVCAAVLAREIYLNYEQRASYNDPILDEKKMKTIIWQLFREMISPKELWADMKGIQGWEPYAEMTNLITMEIVAMYTEKEGNI